MLRKTRRTGVIAGAATTFSQPTGCECVTTASVSTLDKKVAFVTGGSCGVGKGIALELIDAGAVVYIMGRSDQDMGYATDKEPAIKCDHRDDDEVRSAVRRIIDEHKRLDILVNNVWGGYEGMMENGQFTWSRLFWQQLLWRCNAIFQPGVRAHYG